MKAEEALRLAREQFPFEAYIPPEAGAHLNIAETVLGHLRPGARILDFGCGPCDKTAVLQNLGYQCTGYDDLQDHWHGIDDNRHRILEFAKSVGIDFRLAGKDDTLFSEKQQYDMVMLHDVLEHLHDSPRDLLNDLLELVKPEGLLFVTVPSAVNIRKRFAVLAGKTNLPDFDSYYWYPVPWRGHVREYVKDDLARLCENLDLTPVELRGCHHMLQKVPAPLRSVYMAVTRIFPNWRDSWSLVARKNPKWAPRRTLPREELAKILRPYGGSGYQVCDPATAQTPGYRGRF